MYDRAGLTHQQRTFIEGLLRSLELGTYLSEHVASASSVVLALTRATVARCSSPPSADGWKSALLTRSGREHDHGVTADYLAFDMLSERNQSRVTG